MNDISAVTILNIKIEIAIFFLKSNRNQDFA